MTPLFWHYLATADLSPTRVRELFAALEPGEDPVARLRAVGFLTPEERKRLDLADPAALRKYLDQGLEILTADTFPESMNGLSGMPPCLFTWGDRSCLDEPTVAIVGTRGASTYGKAVARKFAEAFAMAGVTVVSGGALGIDAAAHEGALDAGGRTAAVLGQGIDRVFPTSHRELFGRIRGSGCLVSQFALGTPSLGRNFPRRNQLIAALSLGVLVVEAPQKSGAIITTSAAAEMGKQIFVVPATITMESFRGSHALIRDGAQLVDHPDQVLEALGVESRPVKARAAQALPPVQASILAHLGGEPVPTERLLVMTGMEPGDLMAELTLLEMDGLVIQGPGGYTASP